MDLLFKIFTPRKAFLFFALLGALSLWHKYSRYSMAWYYNWRYPPQEGPSSAGLEIMSTLDKERSLHVEAKYRQISSRLDEAERQGFKVSGLRAKATAALELNTPAYRQEALRLLSEVEISIPTNP